MVKTTLGSAARPQRARARHLECTYISSGTLQSHLCFTSVTLVTHLFLSRSHIVHLISKVSSECFITEFLGLKSQFLQSTGQFFGFQQRLHLVLSPLCHLKSLSVHSRSQRRHSLFTVNDCCPLTDFEVNQEGTPLGTTYSLTDFLAADNKVDIVPLTVINSLLYLKLEWNTA